MVPCFAVERSILLTGTIAGFLLRRSASARRDSPHPQRLPRREQQCHASRPCPPGSASDRPTRCCRQARADCSATDPGCSEQAAERQAGACRQASISRSMPAALPTRVHCVSATKAQVFVGTRLGNKVTATVMDVKTEIKTIRKASIAPTVLGESTRERSTSPSFRRSRRSRTCSSIRQSRR